MNITMVIVSILCGILVGFVVKVLSMSLCIADGKLTKEKIICLQCGRKLSFVQSVMFVILHAKCPHCNNKLPFSHHIIEIVVVGIYIISGMIVTNPVKWVVCCVMEAILVTASITDINIMKVPYCCSLLILLLGVTMIAVSVVEKNKSWVDQLLGSAFIILIFTLPTLMGHLGGGDYQLMVASGLVLGVKRTIIAFLLSVLLGFFGSLIELFVARKDEKDRLFNNIRDIFSRWYDSQKTDKRVLCDGETDTICINIFNSKISINEYSYNEKKWSLKPDIDKLKNMLESDCSFTKTNYAVSINVSANNIEDFSINKISCKNIVPFVPYLSVAIVITLLLFV